MDSRLAVPREAERRPTSHLLMAQREDQVGHNGSNVARCLELASAIAAGILY